MKEVEACRSTVLPAFRVPESATLTPMPNGAAQVMFHVLSTPDSRQLIADTRSITPQQVTDFNTTLNRAQFWQLPTESSHVGEDGTEYILEGVHDGAYHIVVRWCPGAIHQKAFADVARRLFDLSGHRLKDGC